MAHSDRKDDTSDARRHTAVETSRGSQGLASSRLDQVREEERLVEEVERSRDRMRDGARAAMGVAAGADVPPFSKVVAGSGTGWYPLLALGVLTIVDEFQSYGFAVMGPEISKALGLSKETLAGLVALKTLAVTLAALPMAAYVQRKARRGLLATVTAFGWSAMTLFTAFVANAWGLLVNLVIDGATTGSVQAIHQPLLVDSYPPEVRVRILTAYRNFAYAGNMIAPALVGLCAGALGFTWRGVFLVMGLVALCGSVFSLRLRDPGFGKWDEARLRQIVRNATGYEGDELGEDEVALGFFEIVRRLFLVPTLRRLLAAFAVIGMMLIPLNTYLFFFLEDEWGMGPGARGLFFATMPVFSIAALQLFSTRGETLFQNDPRAFIRLGAWLLGVGLLLLAFGIFVPVFIIMSICIGAAFAAIAVVTPILWTIVMSIVESRMRSHAAALAGIFTAAVGGFGGLLLLGGIDRRFGTAGAIVSLAIPGVTAALILRTTTQTIQNDIDQMVDRLVEAEELGEILSRGRRLPMLACRHIDFSYGQVQVLFDVDFTVDDSEMVALLGTNGAGKSTLLRVISGLGLPSSGTVRYRGADITYLDAERRLKYGITQVPGGRAVFGALTVADNLRAYGFSLGRGRKRVDAGMEASFEAFPRLGERRNQLASTLSGGEQQMLGLSKALILSPRLLVIDELSLGLAPKIVGELLAMTRRINETGTAIVLVEQSVNIALSLVDHAYFMEKGEIRFDGRADELVERGDLLRSVFLEGAAKGM